MSQGLEVLIVFVLPNFNLCLLENRTLMKKLNRNPTEEEYSSAWSKILWYTDSSQRFAKEIYIIIDSFDNVQDKLSLAASLLYVVFFSKTSWKGVWIIQHCSFAFWLHIQWKYFVRCYSFREPIKTFIYWRLSNDCQIAFPAFVSILPNRKPYNKHHVSLVFSVHM